MSVRDTRPATVGVASVCLPGRADANLAGLRALARLEGLRPDTAAALLVLPEPTLVGRPGSRSPALFESPCPKGLLIPIPSTSSLTSSKPGNLAALGTRYRRISDRR